MTDITSVTADVNVVVEHTTFADEEDVQEGVQEGTFAMPNVVDSSSSDKSFSRESTPCTLNEEVPSATDGSAETFKDGEFTNALHVPSFRPKGKATLPTTNKPPPKGGN